MHKTLLAIALLIALAFPPSIAYSETPPPLEKTGESSTQPEVTLRTKETKNDTGRAWKISFAVGAIASVGLWGLGGHHRYQANGPQQDKLDAAFDDLNQLNYAPFDNLENGNRCANSAGYSGARESELAQVRSVCDAGNRHADRATIFVPIALLATVATAYFGYKGWIADNSRSRKRGITKRKDSSKSEITFLPSLTPESVSASMFLRF